MRPLTQTELDTDRAWHTTHALPAITHIDRTTALAADFTPGIQAAQTDRDGGRSTDVSDPTGNTATNTRHDPTLAYPALLAAAWRQYIAAAQRLTVVTQSITAHAEHIDRAGAGSRQLYCANRYCEQPIEVGAMIAGRCKPCANYLHEHQRDAAKGTVDARNRKREQRARPTSEAV